MAATQDSAAIRNIGSGAATDVTFSIDGKTLYEAHGGMITAYNVATGAAGQTWTLGTQLRGIDVSTDGHYLIAVEQQAGPRSDGTFPNATTDYYVYRLDLQTGAKTTFTSHVNEWYSASYYDAAFLADGTVLLTRDYPGSGWTPLTLLDPNSGSFTTTSQVYAQSGTLTATTTHNQIAFLPQNVSTAPLFVYTTGAGVTATHDWYADNVMGFNSGVQAISSAANLVVQGPALNIYDTSLHYIQTLSGQYSFLSIRGLTFDPSGQHLYALGALSNGSGATTGTIYSFSTANWDVVASYNLGALPNSGASGYGNALTLSADGRYLSVMSGGQIEMVDLAVAVADGPTNRADVLTGTDGDDVIHGLAGDDVITGGAGNDTLYGDAGNDTLDGGAGFNQLTGGLGDDTYYVGSIYDTIYENLNEGTDLVISSIGYSLDSGSGGGLDNLTLTGTANIDGSGNQLANVITGNAGNNKLSGQAGNDTLIGGAGNDMLDGGTGGDTMAGGTGNDVYVVDQSGDRVIENSGEGDDIVMSSISYLLDTNVERLQLTGSAGINGIGNALNNVITGNGGNNRLTAAGGHDVIDGGAGTDTLVLSGTRASYAVLTIGGQTFVTNSSEGALVTNVEKVQFADGTFAWNSLVATALPFDAAGYVARYADLRAAFGNNADAAAAHFARYGFLEGRVGGSFDALEYLASNPDLARAFATDRTRATAHYVEHGIAEGRATQSFDPLAYLAANPDLARAYGIDRTQAETHYILYGLKEGRPTGFDAMEYLASNRDLAISFGSDTVRAEQHYILFGLQEGRPTASFDALRYLASNPDLALAVGTNQAAAERHYVENGIAEGRSTTAFDPLQYLAANKDLILGLGDDPIAAERHYIEHGVSEGRATSGFDVVAYELSNPDLARAGMTPAQALFHWIDHGAAEGRSGDALYGREQGSHAASVGGTISDTLATPGDHDWFQATLTAGQHIRITLSSTTLAPTLAIADDHGAILQTANAAHSALIDFTADHNGLYYFTAAASDPASAGNYMLSIEPVA